jgi:two-component system sensor histidine kinase BaeS
MPRRVPGLAARLLTAQALIVVVAAVTLWVVASAVGPAIFHNHLHRANVQVTAETNRHIEEAFRSASAISIGVATLASLVAAIAVSVYVTRRIAEPVSRLAAAARAITAGQRPAPVATAVPSSEFADLTAAFNAMATRLDAVETTRRRLLGDLAHEMRTPVSTLDAYLQGVEDGMVDLDAATVGTLRTQTARLARLAEDITAVSRAEEHQLDLHPEPVAPGELLTAATDAAQDRFAAKRVELIGQIEPGLARLHVDPDRIGQVLGNLLDNALRHTPAGGTVTVSAAAAANELGLAVADTGEGIRAEHLSHVFERFYRVDRARDRAHGGSGIGLAIAKAIVEAHGGTIHADSPGPGQGATFTITLPAR